jgi:hypothetical protein
VKIKGPQSWIESIQLINSAKWSSLKIMDTSGKPPTFDRAGKDSPVRGRGKTFLKLQGLNT